jgi:hypothetical protein
MMVIVVVVFGISLILIGLLFCGLLEMCRRMDEEREKKHWMED